MLSDLTEAVEHIMNIRSTKDTTLFLLGASALILTFEYIFVYLPIMLIILITYNFATKWVYWFYESDKAKALKFTVVR